MNTNIDQAQKISDGLFPHQVEGITFLLNRRRAILADDMGLGKTRQAIIAMREAAPQGPYLVVCPASVKHNWKREIQIVAREADVRIVDGKTSALQPANSEHYWVVVNYDILSKHHEWLEQIGWAGFVFDEAHYLKNHNSQRTRFSRRLLEAASNGTEPAVYALTGTPLTNRPRDLFPLLQITGHSLGRSFLSFAKRYCDAYQNEYGWITDGASNLEELAVELHGVMLRRNKDEVLNLPPKIRTWLPVEVPDGTGNSEVSEVVRILVRNQLGKTLGGDKRIGRTSTAQEPDRIRLLATLTKARKKIAVAKVANTLGLVEDIVEQDEKAIVFSCFDEPVKKIKKHFGEKALLLTGATPNAQRQGIVDRFQNDDTVRVLVANIIAGGIGLNLTAARQVVFNDLDWVPANHWQAEDRAYRIGQTASVNVTYLVGAGTVDDFVQTVLETKSKLVAAVVEGTALDSGVGGNILSELEHLIGKLSPHLADYKLHELGDEKTVRELLEKMTEQYRNDFAPSSPKAGKTASAETLVSKEALMALARALTGPQEKKYRVESSSKPGSFYEITVDASGDAECLCPGFNYRGTCSHARKLKAAIVRGEPVPEGFWQMDFAD